MRKLKSVVSGALLGIAAACGIADKQETREVMPAPADSVVHIRSAAQAALTAAVQVLDEPERRLSLLTTTSYIEAQRYLQRALAHAQRLPAAENALKKEVTEGKLIVDAIRDFRTHYLSAVQRRHDPNTIPQLLQALEQFESNTKQFSSASLRRWKAAASVYQLMNDTYSVLLSNGISDEAQAERMRQELKTKATRVYQALR